MVAAAEKARRARSEWDLAERRHRELAAAQREAWQAVLAVAPDRAQPARRRCRRPLLLAEDVADLRAEVHRRRAAASRGRPPSRPPRTPSGPRAVAGDQPRTGRRGRAAGYRRCGRRSGIWRSTARALEQAAAAHEEALAASQAAEARARQAEVAAAGERAKQEAAAMRLGDAIEQHAKLAELESEARHLARASDLLADFRNTVVAAVGPRLAVQAAELFAELTDHEYDQLQVDPETYQLQITDAGRVYGLDRFSGSEIDLANLALRVAISEHVHLQSGGSIGLLVLDEVFGPLDEDRKARMLLALERLRGRFRQIIVVTHDASIKEQLPNAIEVIKLPGRRATAQPMVG